MRNLLKLLMATILIFGISITELQVAQASEQESQEENVQIEQVNESTMQLHLDDNVTFHQNEDGNAYLVDNKNNKEEALPSIAEDINGNPVSLVYVENQDGVEVQVLNQFQLFGWLQCSLGTAGGMGTGGLAGAGVGSSVPGIGTVAGGIIGGVSGGMTGAAASCFN